MSEYCHKCKAKIDKRSDYTEVSVHTYHPDSDMRSVESIVLCGDCSKGIVHMTFGGKDE